MIYLVIPLMDQPNSYLAPLAGELYSWFNILSYTAGPMKDTAPPPKKSSPLHMVSSSTALK